MSDMNCMSPSAPARGRCFRADAIVAFPVCRAAMRVRQRRSDPLADVWDGYDGRHECQSGSLDVDAGFGQKNLPTIRANRVNFHLDQPKSRFVVPTLLIADAMKISRHDHSMNLAARE